MKRGHICVAKGFPKGEQESILKKAGVKVFYVDDLDSAIRSTRKGEGLYVAGLTGLASSKNGIKAALAKLHKKGAHAVDAATGRKSNGSDAAELAMEAAGDLQRHVLGGWKEQEEAGRRGGQTYAKNYDAKRAPLSTLKAYWFNLNMTAVQACEAASRGYEIPWLWRAAHNRLGPRTGQRAVTKRKK